MNAQLTNPAVAAFVTAVNAGDRDAFFAALTPDATMSDDGTDRDLNNWAEKEIFSSNGRMDIESASPDGLTLTVNYTNSTWGSMRTRWAFTVTDGKISRFETGQA
ncbi:nuclear transport factor 2 family protein [Streptomyces flavofungini]|uniref:nuclear transport factor 2 family protein n=1 Tax=Streptomyces flavofungini TaxID=68200 RepID=UPI0025B187A7|nr:nuclear transport factor 2 family protein [Streptomyces flavofungini]WJV47108.1 nuclear transport factor 2 family protein [Streptomyces flavofungini]